MDLRKVRIVVGVFGVLIALYSIVFAVDYSNLNWMSNSSAYIQILSGACIAVAMFFSNKIESKRLNENDKE